MVIRPPALTKKERDAIIRRLYKEQRQFLRDLVLCQAGIGPESKKDLQQRVLMALTAHVENHRGPPTNPRGFLRRVVKNEVCDHWKERRVEVQYGADPDAELSPAPDPEGTAELAEKRAKLERYLCLLTPKEAQVVRCLDLFDLTIKQTAKAVGLPDGTVATVHARAVKKLEALGAASERGTLLGRSG
jgi:RNA polymerase sigma factor (sigma-70 family)